MNILGIETSCDETAAAIVTDGWDVRSNVIASSLELHVLTGGIVPEVAARDSALKITRVIQTALEKAHSTWNDIDAIAVTNGPGLLGSLLVGIEAAKTLAMIHRKPLIPVFHIAGHILSNILERPTPLHFPIVSLTVAGGHNDLYLWEEENEKKMIDKKQSNTSLARVYNACQNQSNTPKTEPTIHDTRFTTHVSRHMQFTKLGGTIDDAAGEAFDKGARMLGLPYPGGPALSRLAVGGDPNAVAFPRPMRKSGDYNFSFSGLKTAMFYEVKNRGGLERLSAQEKSDLAASYQESITDILSEKLFTAADQFGAKEIHLAGGVSANTRLREKIGTECAQRNISFRHPAKIEYCTDNAAMIACAGYSIWQQKYGDMKTANKSHTSNQHNDESLRDNSRVVPTSSHLAKNIHNTPFPFQDVEVNLSHEFRF